MATSLETLLRQTALEHGHIQLFRDECGWQADVCHYRRDPRDARGGKNFTDPVDALRAALIEDERIAREVALKYRAAPKAGDDAPPAIDTFEDMFG